MRLTEFDLSQHALDWTPDIDSSKRSSISNIDYTIDNTVSSQALSGQNDSSEQNAKLFDFLQTHCSDFINVLKTNRSGSLFLYRGVDDYRKNITSVPSAFVSSSVENRTPRDTDVQAQQLLDAKLSAAGFTALRHNSTFCTGSQAQAESYKNNSVYLIFPVNGYSFSWNKQFKDLTMDFGLRAGDLAAYKKYSKNSDFWTLYNTTKRNQLDDLFNLPAQEFVEKYQFYQSDLLGAMASKKEILIHGKYVALTVDQYKDQIQNWLVTL